ncbi:helix-turn-helix transcriptional regulator [Streptomyces sp. NPDC051577]|uniref:helix-turn-helix domain-containing protein n=1 Tax=Streptomyces sp. NPDC051577 TaxID=3155166 RepID=UPI0034188A4C
MRTDSTTRLNVTPLRAAREAKGLSLRAAALRSGIDPGHLSKVERGERQLSIEALYRLALVVDLDELAAHLQRVLPRGVARQNRRGAPPQQAEQSEISEAVGGPAPTASSESISKSTAKQIGQNS